MIILLYKEAFLNTNEFDPTLPSSITSLLQKYEDVFLKEAPYGLPPMILCLEQPFQIDQPIGATWRRPRNFKGKLMN